MKKAFSMAEVLVTLMVISIVAALTIPVIVRSSASGTKTLYKAAFSNVETLVNELINDVAIYPGGEFTNNTFCANFFAKVNTIGYNATSCANTFAAAIPGTPNAVTTNGMRWYNMDNDFGTDTCPDSAAGECVRIAVDVNGAGKGVNSVTAADDIRDILYIYIFKTGKVSVGSGTLEATYLTN